jgi:hypothetical protein
MYALRSDAPHAAVERLRNALRDCGRFIPEVLHAAVGSNRTATPLHLVWEHAYASPEAYRRYMAHPFHAAVLDRYLLADSPERVVADSALGAGLAGYTCTDAATFHCDAGVRRVVLLDVAAGASLASIATLGEMVHEAARCADGTSRSAFAENGFASRWFDGESEITAPSAWTHLYELAFASDDALAAYRAGGSALAAAERDGWQGWADGIVRRTLDVEYVIEPGVPD